MIPQFAFDQWLIPRVLHLAVYREDDWAGWTYQAFVGLVFRGRWMGRFLSITFPPPFEY
jgi:hypothetical protein